MENEMRNNWHERRWLSENGMSQMLCPLICVMLHVKREKREMRGAEKNIEHEDLFVSDVCCKIIWLDIIVVIFQDHVNVLFFEKEMRGVEGRIKRNEKRREKWNSEIKCCRGRETKCSLFLSIRIKMSGGGGNWTYHHLMIIPSLIIMMWIILMEEVVNVGKCNLMLGGKEKREKVQMELKSAIFISTSLFHVKKKNSFSNLMIRMMVIITFWRFWREMFYWPHDEENERRRRRRRWYRFNNFNLDKWWVEMIILSCKFSSSLFCEREGERNKRGIMMTLLHALPSNAISFPLLSLLTLWFPIVTLMPWDDAGDNRKSWSVSPIIIFPVFTFWKTPFLLFSPL